MKPPLTLAQAVKVLGPPAKWKGQCYRVAAELVASDLLQGTAVYGHWLGAIHRRSMFAGKLVVHHGWVSLTAGGVVDPTRWVFECKKPYLYWSPVTGPEYDEGGNRWREANTKPPPRFSPVERTIELAKQDLSLSTWLWLEQVLGADYDQQRTTTLSISQVVWLANLPLSMLGPHARSLFAVLAQDRYHLRAIIPLDNYRLVMSTRWSPV
jgi:hypothetical protein